MSGRDDFKCFLEATFAYLEPIGLIEKDDEKAGLTTLALLNQYSFSMVAGFLILILEKVPAAEQQSIVDKLGHFGPRLVETINNQGTDDNEYILYLGYLTLEKPLFQKLIQIGIISLKYIDAQLRLAGEDPSDQEKFNAFWMESNRVISNLCIARQRANSSIESFLERLDAKLFLDALLFEFKDQSKELKLKLFADE